MDVKHFEEVNVIMGEGQDEYRDLPAYLDRQEHSITVCFKPTQDEILKIYETGEIWFKQLLPASGLMNPIQLTVNKEELIPK